MRFTCDLRALTFLGWQEANWVLDVTDNREELVKGRMLLILRELWGSHDRDWPDAISHYMPLEAFKSIVANRELWLTHQCDLGATEEGEVHHANDIINAELQHKWLPKSIDRHNNDFWKLGTAWHHYCVCFCRSAEQPHMWRCYAGNGTGCAIVFSFSELVRLSAGGHAYWLAPMLYPRAEQSAMVVKMLRRNRKLFTSIRVPSNERDEFWREVVFRLGFGCGLRFKRERFSAEREVRLASAQTDAQQEFISAGKRRVRLPIDLATVRRVVRGPNSELSVAEIRDFLGLRGWKCLS